MLDTSRIQKELVDCNRDTAISGVSIDLRDGANLTHLCGTISGPLGTPYEGGTFVIDIQLPSDYPFEPPKMQFITRVWALKKTISKLVRETRSSKGSL